MGTADFSVGQRVRLVLDVEGVPAGTEGTVIGFYARETATVVVRFEDVTLSVEPSSVEPVDPSDATAGR